MPTYTYVSIDKVSPASGTTFGGTAVTITGFGFSLATGVTFDGVAATQIVYVSNTTITCVTPLHASGAVTVAVLGVGTLAAGYTYVVPVSRLPPYPYQSPITQSGASPDGLVSAAWANWWNVVKTRIEGLPGSVAAESVIGVFTASQIPQLPSSRLTMNAPRLLGRTTAGSGNSEEIQVAAGLTLASGILSITGLPGGYAIGDLLYADSARSLARLADVAAGSYLRSGGVATAPLWSTLTLPNAANSGDIFKASGANAMAAVAPGALTKTDDTNVTLTLGGAASTALVNAASVTVGWTGTLAAARLNANVVQSVVNDTNVTGSIATQALTLGWTGTLALARGGTAANLSATGGANQVLKQASVGGAITVGTLAVANLSDGTNVALLNATNLFTVSPQTIGTGTTGTNTAFVTLNGGSGSGGGGAVSFQRNSVLQGAVGTTSAIIGGASSDLVVYAAAGNGIAFYTNAANMMALSSGGVLTVSGLGTHAFLASGVGVNTFYVRNSAAGTGNYAQVLAISDTVNTYLKAYASTFTTSAFEVAAGGSLQQDGVGGLSIAATNASGVIRFYVRGSSKTQEFNQGATFTGAMGAAANSLEILTMANGTGSKTGSVLYVGHNSSGGGAPGLVVVNAKDATTFALWPDTNGIWQSSNATLTGVPEEDGTPLADTGGTVLGSVGINTGAALVFDGATKNNNVSPGTGNIVRVTSSGVVTGTCLLTGITGGVNGRVVWVMNTVTTQSIQFNGEDAGSTAANRIAVTLLLPIGCSRALIYDGTSSRWRPF